MLDGVTFETDFLGFDFCTLPAAITGEALKLVDVVGRGHSEAASG
jgi:hypothetical protein